MIVAQVWGPIIGHAKPLLWNASAQQPVVSVESPKWQILIVRTIMETAIVTQDGDIVGLVLWKEDAQKLVEDVEF